MAKTDELVYCKEAGAWGHGFFWINPLVFITLCFFMTLGMRGRIGGCMRMIGGHGGPSENDSPEDIAKRRYAAGKIDKKEFERIRKNLGAP